MTEPNRRGFLIAAGATVAGAAAVVAATRPEAPEPVGAPGSAGSEESLEPSEHSEILAHVHDVRTGTISLMVEGHQVQVTDPTLARRIAGALRTPTTGAV